MSSVPVPPTLLRDSAGSAWFRERGIVVLDPSGLQLYANEIQDAGTRLTRIWHSRIEADVQVQRDDSSSLIFLQIEGVSTIEMDEWENPVELRPGGVAVFPAGAKFRMRSTSEIVRYECGFDLEVLSPLLREMVASGFVENEPLLAYRQLVVGAASTALSFGLSSAKVGFSFFLEGFRSFLTALLVQALEQRQVKQLDGATSLYETALGVIRHEFRNSDFSVRDLAASVGVSTSYLRRVFSNRGTSPKSTLREVRLKAAQEILMATNNGTRVSREEIARLSGFRDARTLRRATEQHDRRQDDAASVD